MNLTDGNKIKPARRSWKYAAAGFLLGLGCPAGLLLARYFAAYGDEVIYPIFF